MLERTERHFFAGRITGNNDSSRPAARRSTFKTVTQFQLDPCSAGDLKPFRRKITAFLFIRLDDSCTFAVASALSNTMDICRVGTHRPARQNTRSAVLDFAFFKRIVFDKILSSGHPCSRAQKHHYQTFFHFNRFPYVYF